MKGAGLVKAQNDVPELTTTLLFDELQLLLVGQIGVASQQTVDVEIVDYSQVFFTERGIEVDLDRADITDPGENPLVRRLENDRSNCGKHGDVLPSDSHDGRRKVREPHHVVEDDQRGAVEYLQEAQDVAYVFGLSLYPKHAMVFFGKTDRRFGRRKRFSRCRCHCGRGWGGRLPR